MKTIAECAIGGGHGDRIMATGGDPNRPGYILHRTPERDTFNTGFRVEPGHVELRFAAWARARAPVGCIMVEPHIKNRHSADNKAWPWRNWCALAAKVPLLQCVAPGAKALPGVTTIRTETFDHAVAVLAQSRGIVTTEGGLHHAAGALGKPAVVIFGAFNLPSMFGYDFHQNVWEPDPQGLGQRRSHPACRAAMARITVERVLAAMDVAFA